MYFGACGSSTPVFNTCRRPISIKTNDNDRFPATVVTRVHVYWRLRSFFGDCRSPISSYLMITIVYQHLRELDLSLLSIATDFNQEIPGPWYKFKVNPWIFGNFCYPSLNYRNFQGLLWRVDTLAIILFTAHYFPFSSLAVNLVVVLFYH